MIVVLVPHAQGKRDTIIEICRSTWLKMQKYCMLNTSACSLSLNQYSCLFSGAVYFTFKLFHVVIIYFCIFFIHIINDCIHSKLKIPYPVNN